MQESPTMSFRINMRPQNVGVRSPLDQDVDEKKGTYLKPQVVEGSPGMRPSSTPKFMLLGVLSWRDQVAIIRSWEFENA